MTAPPADAPLLALDTGSPVTSAAFGTATEVLASESLPTERSSSEILSLIDRALTSAGAGPGDVRGIVALRGPGSFTGLRVGMATAIGLHQALGVPAIALSTLEVLAFSGAPAEVRVGAVDALRGEWFVQPYQGESPWRPLAEPSLMAATDLRKLAPGRLIGFRLPELELDTQEPGPLAAVALRLLETGDRSWDPAELTRPLYLRAPAVRAGS